MFDSKTVEEIKLSCSQKDVHFFRHDDGAISFTSPDPKTDIRFLINPDCEVFCFFHGCNVPFAESCPQLQSRIFPEIEISPQILPFVNILSGDSLVNICSGIDTNLLSNFELVETKTFENAVIEKIPWRKHSIYRHCKCQLLFTGQYSRYCSYCKSLRQAIVQRIYNAQKVSSPEKKASQQASSHTPFQHLSPRSMVLRANNLSKMIKHVKRLNSRLRFCHKEVTPEFYASAQSDFDQLEQTAPATLFEKLFESDASGTLQQIWEDRKKFYADQQNGLARTSLNQRKGMRFNPITLRIALAIFSRCPSAYRAMKQFSILSLPSESTLKSYIANYRHGSGIDKGYMEVLKAYVDKFNRVTRESPNVVKDGWIIFDETVISAGISWNCLTGNIDGYAMKGSELGDLSDLFDKEESKLTDHVLLFMFRSSVHHFEMIGPHFTSSGNMSATSIVSCLFEFTHCLISAGFEPSLIICDGASPNLSAIKSLMSDKASTFRDNLEISPVSFNFAGVLGLTMHYMICPPHQLKNMVNALNSSQESKPKSFMLDGYDVTFKHVIAAFYREVERMSRGGIGKVPGLNHDVVFKDAWNCMSVPNNKVIVRGHLTAEMLANAIASQDWAALKTIEYIQVLENLFCDVFLHDKTGKSVMKFCFVQQATCVLHLF
eukprot:Pompholyxophrys_punicea_v1_NODE_280_length_2395_cov_11.619231.p1 type:complete len:661 gc:universal NODE_280_length_2395_cov_11.619231:400-2382(+)